VQKAFAVLAGPVIAVWLFLVVTTPLVAVLLMLAAVTWQDYRRRRQALAESAGRGDLLRSAR
jgi:multisubunit Na+/H+ antiporter MnhG subunit